ncbi:hypothetical protein Daesc_002391 [Daldinia eschscholtzii]|uniref:Uncharacterized protein n=1 Tax=Daldinia eschscholtzii TaxID=292717 RepID=A0AAX6MX55_9PEZI
MLGFASKPPKLVDLTFIVELEDAVVEGDIHPRDLDELTKFRKHASKLPFEYTVAHEYRYPGIFVGLSIELRTTHGLRSPELRLSDIPGVVSVSPVYELPLSDPDLPELPSIDNPFRSYANPPAMPKIVPKADGDLSSALEMAGVDKLHQLGVKGKGIKIGIVDTGVDYRHPALGRGFGPGFKVAGGWSWLTDNGTAFEHDNPLTTCYGGGHGTHVTGIVGMDPLLDGDMTLNVSGVAPEATVYMYRVFDCSTNGGSTDRIMAAMLRAQADGVDIISMSLGIQESWQDGKDPLTKVVSRLADAGVAVIVSQGNAGSRSKYDPQLYRTSTPAELPSIISVGSIANKKFPLVYTAADSRGATISYASLWPIEFPDGLEVYLIDDGCSGTSKWDDAVTLLENQGKLNTTIIAFPITNNCRDSGARGCCSRQNVPYIMGLYTNMSDPYDIAYEIPSSGSVGDGSVQYISVIFSDSTTVLTNMNVTGAEKYRLYFNDTSYSSPYQVVGGKMDYYSAFGPLYLNYNLKPQISAPGGEILSTWPLGEQGYYSLLSGTSMAAPFLSGCYALVKSQFPDLSVKEILSLLQSTSEPTKWVYNDTITAGTFQQGSGMVNAYKAITYQSRVSPGQLLVTDNTRTTYGAVNITIMNTSNSTKRYFLSHEGASYSEPNPPNNPIFSQENQLPIYGSAEFESPNVEIPAGESIVVPFKILPPISGIKPERLPVFGGFIKVTSEGEEFSVPYSGPPYSLYNARYIHVLNTSTSVQPQISYKLQDGWTINKGMLEVNSSILYRSLIGRDQFTRGYRIDLVPANISIIPDFYGYDPAEEYEYRPSNTTPPISVFESPSYGTLVNSTDLLSPSTFNWPQGTGVKATLPNATEYSPGPGDYRWLVSVLRWGGDLDKLEDHETWLSAVIRFVDGPASKSL